MARRRLLFPLFVSSTLAVIVACSADGGGDAILFETAEPVEPAPTNPLPPSNRPDDASIDVKDAASDAPKDAKPDTFDAGKPAPNPGDACKTLDEVFDRKCGICGNQQALCEPKPDGTAGVVSAYSPCVNELAGGCMPGTVESEACGNCGTRTRTCNMYCAWTTSACTGEPPGACTPTTHDYTTAGCPTAGTLRTRSCASTCTWSGYSACGALDFKLTVSGTVGNTVSAIYPLRATQAGKRLTGTCPNGTLSTTTNHPYLYVEVVNPTDATLTLSAWNATAPGGVVIDTLMGWYTGNVRPADDNARKACAKGIIDACPTGTPCPEYQWAGVTGANAITLPPFGSALVYFASYYAAGGTSATEGNVKLVVRTDSSQ
ncbi:MAG: hypothetical protein KF819_27900 [Labilithrix sp.]|nr:hypothetical protein [Labilithrix sp.]